MHPFSFLSPVVFVNEFFLATLKNIHFTSVALAPLKCFNAIEQLCNLSVENIKNAVPNA